ncbi:MAG: efflux RND transporter periplasmic adaptor subunit [Schleiferiaceae bacterium]
MRIFYAALILGTLVSCSQQQQGSLPPPSITYVTAQTGNIPVKKEFVGQVYGIKDIQIRARVEGYLEQISFEEGTRVTKDDPLYLIDPQPFMAQVAREKSTLAEAKIQLTKAKSDLDRVTPLVKINAVSQSDYDAADAEYKASIAAVEAAEAQLEMAEIELSYADIHAPISGLIGKTKAKVGEFVGRDPNPVILNTVSKIDSFRVEFFLTESDYLRFARKYIEEIRNGDTTEAREANPQELILSDGSVFEHPGYVDFIDREIDPTTGSILVQATFPNPDRLIRPGQFAKIRTVVSQLQNAVLVPQRSVVQFQGTTSLWVLDSENKAQQRLVEMGPKHNSMWVVNSGIEAGDRVILDGLQKVREGQQVDAKEADFKSIIESTEEMTPFQEGQTVIDTDTTTNETPDSTHE